MIGWIIYGVWQLGWLISLRVAPRFILAHDGINEGPWKDQDFDDKMMLLLLGFMIGLIWPLTVIMTGGYLWLNAEFPNKEERKRVRLQKLDREIHEAERELNRVNKTINSTPSYYERWRDERG